MNRVTHRACLFLAFVVFSSAAGLSAQERGACITRVTEPTSDQGAAYDDETGCVPRQTPDSTLSPSSEWHFDLSPYLWFAGMSGTVGGPLGRQASVHATPSDLLSHFNIGLMLFSEARRGRLVLPVDVAWVRLSDSKALPLPALHAVSANIRVGQLILTPKIGYRVVSVEDKFSFDALAGFRYWHLGQNFMFNPSLLGLNFTNSQSWADPVVGARFQIEPSPKAVVTVAGNAGGFGINAKVDYEIVGLIGYRIKPRWTLQAGYRYLDVDYRRSIIYDIAQSGVVFGVTIAVK